MAIIQITRSYQIVWFGEFPVLCKFPLFPLNNLIFAGPPTYSIAETGCGITRKYVRVAASALIW